MMRNTSAIRLVLTLMLVLGGAVTGYAAQCVHSDGPGPTLPWGEAQIITSRTMNADYHAAAAPVWDADPMNIMLVTESGDHRISVVDGDSFNVLARFAAPATMFGTAEFSPDGRYIFTISPDGWVQKYDIWSLAPVGCVRAGLNSGNIALSTDGAWLAVAINQPALLVILSTDDLSVAAVIEVTGDDGSPSRISAVRSNPRRESFVMTLWDTPKIWEVFYGPNPPAVGFVHDWRIEGPAPHSIRFPIRKITTPVLLGNFVFDQSHEYIIATSPHSYRRSVIDLVIGQKVAEF